MKKESIEQLSGWEFNEAVGKAFGFKPRTTWEILNADETASAIGFDREREALQWLDGHPEVHHLYHVGAWEHRPNFGESIEAAMQVVEKMRERGMLFQLTNRFAVAERVWWVEFATPDGEYGGQHFAQTPAEAICIAALEACRQLGERDAALSAMETKE